MSENYLDRDCNLTLQQALDKYYAQNPGFYKPNEFEGNFKKVFFAHDAAHIVFGCDTNIAGEARLEVWTAFATNLRFKKYLDDYVAALTPEKEVLEGVLRLYTMKTFIKYVLASFSFIKVFFMAKKVNPKWDYYNYQGHLDRSILDIRQEFNIQVI
jgi:ubiquinone biosynthesis protein Coq4